MKHHDGWTESDDGHQLYFQRWQPDDPPRAALLFVHGLSEHSGRYTHVMRYFAARDFDCWAVDYRGHGRSPGLRVHVDRFDDYVEDVAAGFRLVRAKHALLPLFLVGHSQGGLVTLRYALIHSQGLNGIVVSSPFLRVHPESAPPAALQMVANIISTFVPTLMFNKSAEPHRLSRDPAVGQAYTDDPLVSSSVTARWFTSLLKAQADTRQRASELDIPALIMQSGADQLVDPKTTREWAASAPADLVQFEEWHGFYHEMFNELDKERVFERVEAWLDERLASIDS
ncbi:MAG: lysophospholipase [Holophagae bacterium]